MTNVMKMTVTRRGARCKRYFNDTRLINRRVVEVRRWHRRSARCKLAAKIYELSRDEDVLLDIRYRFNARDII